VRLVLAGTPDTAVPSLLALLASRHEVVAVVTRPDARAGRGRTLAASPVKQVALEHGLEVLTPPSPRDPDFLARLTELAPDCCPVVAYGALVPRAALDVPPHGWVNLHFSLLPAWRGAAPVQRALMAGDDVTGATTFVLEEGLDTGPVLGTLTETVRPDDTAGTLLDRLAHAGAGLLVATMDGLADGSLHAVPQPAEGVSLAPKLSTEEAQVRWTLPSHVVDRQVRGCTPAPGAWTTFRGERVKVGPVRPVRPGAEPRGGGLSRVMPAHDPLELAPGELHVTKREVLVGTGSTPVALGEVRPHGKKPMAAADWARGVRIDPGERFDG
jgi:methionyl-tRNA formyltransferase